MDTPTLTVYIPEATAVVLIQWQCHIVAIEATAKCKHKKLHESAKILG